MPIIKVKRRRKDQNSSPISNHRRKYKYDTVMVLYQQDNKQYNLII